MRFVRQRTDHACVCAFVYSLASPLRLLVKEEKFRLRLFCWCQWNVSQRQSAAVSESREKLIDVWNEWRSRQDPCCAPCWSPSSWTNRFRTPSLPIRHSNVKLESPPESCVVYLSLWISSVSELMTVHRSVWPASSHKKPHMREDTRDPTACSAHSLALGGSLASIFVWSFCFKLCTRSCVFSVQCRSNSTPSCACVSLILAYP